MKQSAGILLWRKAGNAVDVLIVHPGGPFWAKKDLGAWSIPKGEYLEGEDVLTAARREFREEIGLDAPEGDYQPLGDIKVSSSKVVHAFTLQADLDIKNFKSNTFEMEWPPRSGQNQIFPECDKAAWVTLATAQQKLVKGQLPFIEILAERLGVEIVAEAEQGESTQASLF